MEALAISIPFPTTTHKENSRHQVLVSSQLEKTLFAQTKKVVGEEKP
jgi:hypothetical protein